MASLISKVAGNIRKQKGFTDDEMDILNQPPAAGAGSSVEPSAPEADPKEEKPQLNSRVAMAILALAPALAGYAAGGDVGGAIGGQAGLTGVKDVIAGEEKTKALALTKEKEAKEDAFKDRATKVQEAQLEQTKKQGESDAQYKARMAAVAEREAGVKEREQAAKSKTSGTLPERLSKLSGEQRKLLDLQIMGSKAVEQMKDAYAGGDNTFSMIGDNKYTQWARSAAEAFGRLQSGGAINKEEEKRFMAMLPGPTDSYERQIAKLKQAEDEFNSRLTNSGFTREEFGIQPVDMIAKARESGQTDILGALIPTAHAGNKPVMTPDDFKRLGREEKLRILGERKL